MKSRFLLPFFFLFASCAALQTDLGKAQAWSKTPGGSAVLGGVQLAASLFAPEFSGVIGMAINSLQTNSTVPTLAKAQVRIAGATGESPSSPDVKQLAAAVVAAASSAPTPAAGLQAAANTVSPPAK